MKRLSIIWLLCLLVVLLTSCSLQTSTDNSNISAEQVVKDHFKWRNEKNLAKLEETLTEKRKGIQWNLDNLEYVKLLEIIEVTNSITNPKPKENTKVFKVKYEIKFKEEKGPQNSGTYEWYYFVVKEQQNSPWLVDDWGV
jgi:hypothetical protein